MTSDLKEYKARIAGLVAYGGDDGAKNALALLLSAVQREFWLVRWQDIAEALPETPLGLVEVGLADAVGRREVVIQSLQEMRLVRFVEVIAIASVARISEAHPGCSCLRRRALKDEPAIWRACCLCDVPILWDRQSTAAVLLSESLRVRAGYDSVWHGGATLLQTLYMCPWFTSARHKKARHGAGCRGDGSGQGVGSSALRSSARKARVAGNGSANPIRS